MLNKLLSDICYVISEDGSWYLATMSNAVLSDLRRNGRVMRSDLLELSPKDIDTCAKDGKYYLVKLMQDDSLRMRSFHCDVKKPQRIPTLNGKTVITITEYSVVYRKVLGILQSSAVSIDGKAYASYVGGIPTSGGMLLMNLTGDIEEVSLLAVKDIRPYILSENAQKLLSGVYKYKNARVTLNRDILEQYYGGVLLSKLESKGVRYRYCYFDILMKGDVGSDYYYRSKFGIEEDFSGIGELIRLCKKHMGKVDSKVCRARRLASVNTLLAGKQSFYVTIPDDAILEKVSSEVTKFSIHCINSVIGCVIMPVMAADEATARSSALSECKRAYGGETEIVGVEDCTNHFKGMRLHPALCGTKLQEVFLAVMQDYIQNFRSYYSKICLIGKEMGITGIEENHVKFLFANVLAKKYRNSIKIEFLYFAKCLITFYGYYSSNTIDDVYKKAVRPICISNIKKLWKLGTKYEGDYGIVESNGVADLYYQGVHIGRTVIRV